MLSKPAKSIRLLPDPDRPGSVIEMPVTTSIQEQQSQLQHSRKARRRNFQQKADYSKQQEALAMSTQNAVGSDNSSNTSPPSMQTMQPQSTIMGSIYDDLIVDSADYDTIDQEDADRSAFEVACQFGPFSTVQAIIASGQSPRTRHFLHHGLVVALRAGNVDISNFLLSAGAPIVREPPSNIFSAPSYQQMQLFEALLKYGWTVNSPGFYGAVLLPRVVSNLPLLRWFLAHGADPNLGEQRPSKYRYGSPDTDSCLALETAASQGSVTAIGLLLDAGAKIQDGCPLHFAAGVCPSSSNPHASRVTPSKEFDKSMIPAMAKYAIVHAVMAGAVERVRWLLAHGADPELKGAFGSAMSYAEFQGGEMRQIVDAAVRARS